MQIASPQVATHLRFVLFEERSDASIFMAHNFYLLIWNIASYPCLFTNTRVSLSKRGKNMEERKVSTNVTTVEILWLSLSNLSHSRRKILSLRKLYNFILFRNSCIKIKSKFMLSI